MHMCEEMLNCFFIQWKQPQKILCNKTPFMAMWGHPHSITYLFPIQSSLTHHSSSHRHTRWLLIPSSSTLSHPPSLSPCL